MEINTVTGVIIDESIKIHSDLGPGVLESVCEELLAYRLGKRSFTLRRQVPIPVVYGNIKM
jgi:GxxExxY protein